MAAAAVVVAVGIGVVTLSSRLSIAPGPRSSYGSTTDLKPSGYTGMEKLSVSGSPTPSPSPARRAAQPPAPRPAIQPPRPARSQGPAAGQVGPAVADNEAVAVIRIDYYLARGAFHIYALACTRDACDRPISGACGAGTLTVRAYGSDRANYVLYSGDFSGCTGPHPDGDFPDGVYQALADHGESRQPGEQVYFQLTGSWHYQDASASINSAGEIPPGS